MSIDTQPSGEQPSTKEIERKFLITELPSAFNLEQLNGTKINQGYLVHTPDAAVRVRQKGEKFYLTYKSAPQEHAAERTELETELTQEQFDTMWPGTEGNRVEKTRYEIPYGQNVIELDVFEGDLSGHMLAEVEFVSTDAADAFTPPDWFGPDVTADKRFGNASIAELGFPSV